ncbi:MAG: hypothetical protein HC854_10295 [Flavobacterium sp.]|nr:hypothetical protein [Flavobacterium sp.]
MVNKLDEIVKYNANEWKETLEKISKDYKVSTGNELSLNNTKKTILK